MNRPTIRGALVISLLTAFVCASQTARASELPTALAQAAIADGRPLVSIVTADIDADGDLDVVASDSALQIHVWVNDGAGHFTAQEPVRSMTWRAVPPLPSVDGRPIFLASCTTGNPPSLDADGRVIAWTLTPPTRITLAASGGRSHLDASTRTPRAPPSLAA
jgi:hypothetical protein